MVSLRELMAYVVFLVNTFGRIRDLEQSLATLPDRRVLFSSLGLQHQEMIKAVLNMAES